MVFIKKKDAPAEKKPATGDEKASFFAAFSAAKKASAVNPAAGELQDAGPFKGSGLFSRPLKDIEDVELLEEQTTGVAEQTSLEMNSPDVALDSASTASSASGGPLEAAGISLKIKRKAEGPSSSPSTRAESHSSDLSESTVESSMKKPAGKTLASVFSKNKKTSSASIEEPTGGATQARGGFFSKFTKRASAREEQPSTASQEDGEELRKKPFKLKKAVVAKAKKTKNVPEKGASSVFSLGGSSQAAELLTELDGGRRVFWRITADAVEQVDEAAVKQVASFSAGDSRFHSEVPLSYGQARDLALSEIGEDCRIVNASKPYKSVHAATVERVSAVNANMGPGLSLLEKLLHDKGELTEEASLITGFLLESTEGKASLAILYHVDVSRGDIVGPQITVNPDNLGFIISQFASTRRIDEAAAKVVLYNNKELLSVFKGLHTYPREDVWGGVSVRKIVWMAALATAGAAGLAGAYAGQAYYKVHALQAQQLKLATQLKTLERGVQGAISGSLTSFAKTQSLDTSRVTQTASELWRPHAKVAMEATVLRQRYWVTMPLTRGNFSSNRPSVLGRYAPHDIEPILKLAEPEGCQKDVPGFSGGINAIQITFNCQAAPRPVHRYLLD